MALVNAGVVVLDCAEAEKLAEFYKGLLGAEGTDATANRIEIRSADGFRMAFRRDVNATRRAGPGPRTPQAHLDFWVDDLDEGGTRCRRTRWASGGGEGRTRGARGARLLDPAGHSFTLRRTAQTAPKRGWSLPAGCRR
ncbi:VOC family protein [Streptomyces thinghirensis]|nr:VOC family protein [Streptomyces thinghirensis]